MKVQKQCGWCGGQFEADTTRMKRGRGKFCSVECARYGAARRSGSDNSQWKGGRYLNTAGYVVVWVGPGERKLEHRLVMESVLGRPLTDDEEVHHRNEIRTDNRPENLELTAKSPHARYHATGGKAHLRTTVSCAQCGADVQKGLATARRRTTHFCSRKCYRAYVRPKPPMSHYEWLVSQNLPLPCESAEK